MKQLDFTLISKKVLTHDVYELVFTASEASEVKPGQYVLFVLPKTGLRRAYSIAYTDGKDFSFIIKRIENGGGGSKEICDIEVGDQVPGLCPLGHFVLHNTNVPKLFIGTGTGFAPLYFQVRAMTELRMEAKSHFVFGVRSNRDRFYEEELNHTKSESPSLDFSLYLSQDDALGCIRGRVTDFLTTENVSQFGEFYLCGSPVMVKDTRAKLEELGVAKEQVFFEQY